MSEKGNWVLSNVLKSLTCCFSMVHHKIVRKKDVALEISQQRELRLLSLWRNVKQVDGPLELPHDLIVSHILTKLQIESILRFMSVSKSWYSALSSSYFSTTHLKNNPFSPTVPIQFLLVRCGSNNYILSYDDGDSRGKLVKLDFEFDVGKDFLYLVGCCNGLICLAPLYAEYFILWNPASQKVYRYFSNEFADLKEYETYQVRCGFGYVSSIGDYKFVRIIFRCQERGIVVLVFSLKEERWRRISLDLYMSYINIRGVLVEHALYWTAKQHGDAMVVEFDLALERFCMLPHLGTFSHFDFLGVWGGCLCKCGINLRGQTTVTILKPAREGVLMSLPEGLSLGMYSNLIGFTRTGKFFIMDTSRTTLCLVDPGSEFMEYKPLVRSEKERISIAAYVPSLASPFPSSKLPMV